MKIIKGATQGRTEWTVRKLAEYINDGTVNFNIKIQRGFVWKKDIQKKSALIRSLILEHQIPPLYFNKVDDVFEGMDGKQRSLTIVSFLNNEFALDGLDIFHVTNDDGEVEEWDLNGYKYSDIPECFQNAIKDYSFIVCYTDNASQEEVAESFYNLNNGKGMSAAVMNRIKAKCHSEIYDLAQHKLFTEVLKQDSLENFVNEDLVAKSHAILKRDDICTDIKWIRPYIKEADITDQDVAELNEVFDRIVNVHGMIEDNKIAKRMYLRTHLVSIVPIMFQSLKDGLSDKQMMEWFVTFFSGKKSPTTSKVYNEASGRGTGKNSAIRKRLEEIKRNYEEYFGVKENVALAS